MTPTDPVGKRKLQLLHVRFARMDPAAVEAVRDSVEALTGSRSTKSLNEAQAWDLLDRLCAQAPVRNPEPVCVEWCPVYTPGRVSPGETAAARIPSQAQVWAIHRFMRSAGIADGRAFLRRRFPREAPDGILRTAQAAWLVTKALRAMAAKSSRRAHG